MSTESSIPWNPSVPSAWKIERVKTLLYRSKVLNSDRSEKQVLSLTLRGVVDNDPDNPEGLVPDDYATYQIFEPGDLVFKLIDLENVRTSRVGLVPKRGIMSSAYLRLRPRRDTHVRFLYWSFFDLYNRQIFNHLGSGVRSTLGADDVLNLPMAVPDLITQRAIADFLDSETARIDALIDKKQRMVALIRLQFESRLAAAFEIRGVPTPALSVVVRIAEGQVDPTMEPFASMTLIAPDHVESGTGRLLGTSSAADQGAISGKYICEEGDVIYSKIRPGLRKVCIAPERCLTSADMYPMRPRPDLMSQFLRFFLLSDGFSSFAVLESERVAMPKINRDAFGRVRIPIPELHIQRRIVDEIQGAQAHLENLTDRLLRQIDLLREHRQALITAAVTGQIEILGVAA